MLNAPFFLDIVMIQAGLGWECFEFRVGERFHKIHHVGSWLSIRHWDRQLRARYVSPQDTGHIQTLSPLRHSEPGALQDLVHHVVAQFCPCFDAEPEDFLLVPESDKLRHLLHDEHQRLVVLDVLHVVKYQAAVFLILRTLLFACW